MTAAWQNYPKQRKWGARRNGPLAEILNQLEPFAYEFHFRVKAAVALEIGLVPRAPTLKAIIFALSQSEPLIDITIPLYGSR